MKETKEKLIAAINACADNATKTSTAIEALQFTQAAQNAANALIGIENLELQQKSILQPK